MSQNCECPCPETVMLPMTGLGLGFNMGPVREIIREMTKDLVSREQVEQMIEEARCECSPTDGFEQSLAHDGWVKLPNGLILQWGTDNDSPNGEGHVTFPIPFPNAVFSVTLGEYSLQHEYMSMFSIKTTNNEGFAYLTAFSGSLEPRVDGGCWMAIGY